MVRFSDWIRIVQFKSVAPEQYYVTEDHLVNTYIGIEFLAKAVCEFLLSHESDGLNHESHIKLLDLVAFWTEFIVAVNDWFKPQFTTLKL